MVTEDQYKHAVKQKSLFEKAIERYHKEKMEAFEKKMKEGRKK